MASMRVKPCIYQTDFGLGSPQREDGEGWPQRLRLSAANAAMYAWKPKTNPWLIAATVALAAFMEVLDTSIANVALPHIAGSLGASADQSTWVLTSYLVANAIVLPMGAWAASVIGRKNFFMLCIVIFTVSSFLCGIAPTLGLLLLFRVFQGVGGGGLQPMAQAIMADSFEPSKRGLAFSLYGLVAVLAPSIGPTLGGWITDNYSWHWIFYINIPVGILTLFLTNRLVEDPPYQKSDRNNLYRIDYIGVSLLVISMGALQITLDKGEEKNWFGSNFIVGFATTFIIAFIALILWEFHAERPLIDLRLFKFKNFAVCAFLMLLTGGLLNATTVLQPQFLQTATRLYRDHRRAVPFGRRTWPARRHAHGRPGGEPIPGAESDRDGLRYLRASGISTPPSTSACSSASVLPPSCVWCKSSPSPLSLFP